RRNRSTREVLAAAVVRVGEIRANVGMTRLVNHLDENYLNARAEKSFDPWRRDTKERATEPQVARQAPFSWVGPNGPLPWDPGLDGPRPPDFRGGGGGAGDWGSGGIGPRISPPATKIRDQWRTAKASEYRNFTRVNYGPKPAPFRSVIRGGRGFG